MQKRGWRLVGERLFQPADSSGDCKMVGESVPPLGVVGWRALPQSYTMLPVETSSRIFQKWDRLLCVSPGLPTQIVLSLHVCAPSFAFALTEFCRSINKKRLKKMWSVHLPSSAQQYEAARGQMPESKNERENLVMHVHSSTVEHVLQNGVTSRSFLRRFWGGHGAYLSECLDPTVKPEQTGACLPPTCCG